MKKSTDCGAAFLQCSEDEMTILINTRNLMPKKAVPNYSHLLPAFLNGKKASKQESILLNIFRAEASPGGTKSIS